MFKNPSEKRIKKIMLISMIFIFISIVSMGCKKSWPEPPDLTGIDTVCLKIERSRSETEGHWIYNDEDIERILGRMDIKFVREGEACDATLTLEGKGNPYGSNYKSESSGLSNYCYTGGKVKGNVIFSIPGKDPFVFPIKGYQPEKETITSCYKTAPFYQMIYKPMLRAFIHLWGPEFAIRNLVWDEKDYIKDFLMEELESMGADAAYALLDCLSYDDYLAGVCARTLGSFGAEPGVVSTLIEKLGSDDLRTRAIAIYALQNIGPEAKDSIPALILLLDDDRISAYDHVINQDAAYALELITGEKLGIDKEAWQAWFELQGD